MGPLYLDPRLRHRPGQLCAAPCSSPVLVGLRTAGDVAALRRAANRSDRGAGTLVLARGCEEPRWGTMW